MAQSEFGGDKREHERIAAAAIIGTSMIRDFKAMQQQGGAELDLNPLDVLRPEHQEAVLNAYLVLSGFHGFIRWLRKEYGEEIREVDGLEPAMQFCLNFVKVYDQEKARDS